MKKLTVILAALCVCAGILLCVVLLMDRGESFDADESTVFVLKDGEVVSTDVESFDTGTYDEEGLKKFVTERIDAYNAANGEGRVTLESLVVEENIAKLIIRYGSCEDYTKFNEVELFCGTMAEALLNGYAFDSEFAEIVKGEPMPCSVSDAKGADGYKVVVFKSNANVKVKGKIAFVSVPNVKLLDKSTVSIKAGNSLFSNGGGDSQKPVDTESQPADGAEGDTEESENTETESGTETEYYDEDELVVTEEESEKVEFNFPEEPDEEPAEDDWVEPVYTYIIYK